jgi:hypothetical protein
MATVNVYVSDALRRQMDEAADQNWSAIAQQAFETHLARLAQRGKAGGCLDDAIERLRASKARYEGEQNTSDYDRGYAWAKDRAEHHDLVSMVEAPDYVSAVSIVRKTSGFQERDEFGDAALPSNEMWEGFVDGATALYNEVAGRL